MRGYKRKGISPRCMIKLDIRKAYDSVGWEAIIQIMELLSFPHQFVNWVKQCITTPTYSIQLNGEDYGYFQRKRGIRQGDPISPLLFVLIMEYLSRLLQQLKHNKLFRFHPMCGTLKLINLCFADDLIVVCRADENSIQCVMKVLHKFQRTIGLSINKAKSQIIFGGVDKSTQDRLQKMIDIPIGEFPLRYLRSPITAARVSEKECERLVQNITSKINSWAVKHLSYAGRCRLVGSVLQGIMTFWCKLFIIPTKVMKRVQSICRNFLWGATASYTKRPLVNWEEVCLPKTYGGLGLRNMELWNRAYIYNYWWDVANDKKNLWVKWIHERYIKNDIESCAVRSERLLFLLEEDYS
ncbi:unnamed protein product [Cuscuta campestris]|uniref:Reverse transcriptase domain-containing protein n=1 Tax=Cuscuta campestris TaxID=132261 RepID=A0A484MMS5_9ASTE|nr:unnamed protein product [Cuscuta campestris]